MLLSLIAVFTVSAPSCPITKYELVEGNDLVKVAESSCDIAAEGCVSQTIELDVGTGALVTFKVKVSAKGGAEFTSETITIKKGCVSIKEAYTTEYPDFGAAKISTRPTIDLPFLALESADPCGVKTIELVEI